jgi:spermidine dehydrogenase
MSTDLNQWPDQDILLGMNRPITRRDFLQGAALAITGTMLACSRGESHKSSASDYYPPNLAGLRGQDLASTTLAHSVRDGKFLQLPNDIVETGEEYDLVVIGAGLAGLAAAYVYHREKRGRSRILILDNHDDFGGHARRNTFHWQGTTLIGPGGTFALEEPEHSPPEAVEIFNELGIDPQRMAGYRDDGFNKRFGLSPAVFFDDRVWPGIKPKWVNGFYETSYEKFFGRSPLSVAARSELVELYTTRQNYLPGLEGEEREKALAALSWEKFIRERMKLGDEAVRFANLYATDLIGLGCDAVSALAGYEVGPGFAGMDGEGFYEVDGILRYAYDPKSRFPDGNHTIARRLLQAILPQAVPGGTSMEEVFNSQVDYSAFDKKENDVRVRLRSMVINVQHDGPISHAQHVIVLYTHSDGRVYRLRARSAIMAGWGMVAKHVVKDLPVAQIAALDKYRYCSAVYINVLLRHWRPMAELGIYEMYLPGGYCTWMHIADPLHVGDYRPEYHPDKPTLLSMYKYIYQPGLDPEEQMIQGRMELENKPFDEFEREIRAELQHMFGQHGFRPADDILAITVNRWGHGYNFFHAPGHEEDNPFLPGRDKLGRISFAGADAGGGPWTQLALQQGRRAALEQVGS